MYERLLAELRALIADAGLLNVQGQATRTRELSLAITKMEEAEHWLMAATDGAH